MEEAKELTLHLVGTRDWIKSFFGIFQVFLLMKIIVEGTFISTQDLVFFVDFFKSTV